MFDTNLAQCMSKVKINMSSHAMTVRGTNLEHTKSGSLF